MNHDSLVLTVKMVRGNECSKAKKLCDSHSRLGEAVLAHLLTFVIRARQRLLELDDCLAPPAPPRRVTTCIMLEVPLGWTFGAVVSDCDMISKIRARQYTRNRHAQPVVSAAKGDAHFRSMRKCSLDIYPTTTASPPYGTMNAHSGVRISQKNYSCVPDRSGRSVGTIRCMRDDF